MPEELTYKRYSDLVSDLFLAASGNVENVLYMIQSTSSDDVLELRERLKTISDDEPGLKALLEKRILLFDSQNEKVKELFIKNEQVLATMDEVTVKFSNINTDSSTDLDLAIEGVKDRIETIEKYSNNH